MLVHYVPIILNFLYVCQSVSWLTSLLKLDKFRNISSSRWEHDRTRKVPWYINKDSRYKNDKILLRVCSLYFLKILSTLSKFCLKLLFQHFFLFHQGLIFLGNDLSKSIGEFPSLRACFHIPTISMKAKLALFQVFIVLRFFCFWPNP